MPDETIRPNLFGGVQTFIVCYVLLHLLLKGLQVKCFSMFPTLIFGIRGMLYFPIVLGVKWFYLVLYASQYSSQMNVRLRSVKKQISEWRDGSVGIVDGIPHKKIHDLEHSEFRIVKCRLITEFGDGLMECLKETLLGRNRSLFLQETSIENVLTNSCFNHLFNPDLRQNGIYVIDLSVYDSYSLQPGYHLQGAKGTFTKNPAGEFRLKSIRVRGKEVVPGDKLWECAKLHFLVCCNNEMLFNDHANSHIAMMLMGEVVKSMPPDSEVSRALGPHFKYLAALNEHIMDTLYTPNSPIFPTALTLESIVGIYNRGREDYRHLTTFKRDILINDCNYRGFEAKIYECIHKFCLLVASKLYVEKESEWFFSQIVREVFPLCQDSYSVETLADLLARILMEITMSGAEHFQTRKLGFYHATLKTKKAFDEKPITLDNTQYVMDTYQRILFRMVFSGDYPMATFGLHNVCGDTFDSYFDRETLRDICKAYPDYISYDCLSSVLDY